MTTRLEWIRGCGNFEDYRWGNALPDLARINFIYGPNRFGGFLCLKSCSHRPLAGGPVGNQPSKSVRWRAQSEGSKCDGKLTAHLVVVVDDDLETFLLSQ